MAGLNGRLYLIGGSKGSTSSNSCEMYDPIQQKWTAIASLNQSKGHKIRGKFKIFVLRKNARGHLIILKMHILIIDKAKLSMQVHSKS